MDRQAFNALLDRYIRGEVSPEEADHVLDSLKDPAMREEWDAAITRLLQARPQGGTDAARREAILRSITSQPLRRPLYRRMLPYVAAAVVAGLAFVFFYPSIFHVTDKPQVAVGQPSHDMPPGGNRAMLTLADGTQVALDSAGNGAIASQGGVQVIKLDSGQLAYNQNGGAGAPGGGFNTLATPRGGQFRIILPDGSRVWLNAASTLRFPTAFSGRDRTVELSGEAYFEIERNASQPFHVKVGDMAVQVLGTNFNVMAYQEEGTIRTSLLEGAVRVRHGASAIQLRPGQQARLSAGGDISVKDDVDMEEVVAWKNGYFQFNHESLQGVMRQIGRWYDAEIAYEGAVPQRQFGGKIERSSSVEDVLKILELSNVRFRIEGKKIIVIP
ncbi:FecR family protein [Chitinophaga lutea]